jgi:selenocysteine lyase/cysteine desulfurase
VDSEEIALHRNATESLETIIFGLKLKAGDEIILSKYDYPNMINAWKQREERDSIKLVWVDPELPSTDDTYLAQTYIDLMNGRTKLVHITHIINWNGQILPVRMIADAAQAKGIEVLVDGAHSFAHFQYKIPDLNCHYFGTSLHKWLSASIGTGMMYVRKDKIASLYPLFGSEPASKNDIRKYEALGTRPFFIEQATQKAIDFFEMIGAERKEKRLFYLKEYWTEQVRDIPGLNILSPTNPEHSCAIATISFTDKKPEELESFLMEQARIHTVGINWHRIQGVRITPNVYTSTKNLDRLVEAIHSFAKK